MSARMIGGLQQWKRVRNILIASFAFGVIGACSAKSSEGPKDQVTRKALSGIAIADPSECDSTQSVCKMRQIRIWKECLRKGQFPAETCDQFLTDGYQICERNYPTKKVSATVRREAPLRVAPAAPVPDA